MKKSGMPFFASLFIGVMILMMVYIFFMILAPASAKVHFRLNAWQYDQATFLFEPSESKLVLLAGSEPGFKAPTIGVIHTIDLESGTRISRHYEAGKIQARGVSDTHIWIKPRGEQLEGRKLDDLSDKHSPFKTLKAYPDLLDITETIDIEGTDNTLRLIGLDGNHYQWHPDRGSPQKMAFPPPPIQASHLIKGGRSSFGGSFRPPQRIGDQNLLEAEFLWDLTQQALIHIDSSDWLLQYRDLKGPKGQLMVAKITAQNQWIWQTNLTEVIKNKKIKSPKLVISTRKEDRIYVLLEDYEQHAHLELVCLDVQTGQRIWNLTI